MDIAKIIIVAFCALSLIFTVGSVNKEIGLFIRIMAGIMIFYLIVTKLSAVIQIFSSLMSRTTIQDEYFIIILKIVGISYLTEFSAEICKDAGEGGMSSNIQLAGKVLITFTAMPILLAVIQEIMQIIQ